MNLGTVSVKWIRSAVNSADLMTKAVSRQVFDKLIGALTGYSGAEYQDELNRQIR